MRKQVKINNNAPPGENPLTKYTIRVAYFDINFYVAAYPQPLLKPDTSYLKPLMLRLLLLFTIVPLVELWLLISIGEIIGPIPTIALILVTGVVGASLARWQGVLCLQTVQRKSKPANCPPTHF